MSQLKMMPYRWAVIDGDDKVIHWCMTKASAIESASKNCAASPGTSGFLVAKMISIVEPSAHPVAITELDGVQSEEIPSGPLDKNPKI